MRTAACCLALLLLLLPSPTPARTELPSEEETERRLRADALERSLGPGLARAGAAAVSPCDESYPENAFRVCWFRGRELSAGEFLGSELEATQPAPFPPSGFAIDHDWGSGVVYAGIAPGQGTGDDISGIWRGRLLFEAGRYHLTTFNSDGVRVFVDEQPLIDEYRFQEESRHGAVIDLSGGEHTVRVEWFGSALTPATTRLRLHWNRVPVPPDEKSSPVVVDVFLLTWQETCLAGNPWTSGEPVNVYAPGHVVHLAFQREDAADLPRAFRPDDPLLATLPLVECFRLGLHPDEIAQARDEVEEFRARIVNWSGGTLDPALRVFEIEGQVNPGRIGAGWWVPPWAVRHLAEPFMTGESDFAIVLSSVHDLTTGRYFDIPFCGGTYGNDYGMGGSGYSWVPDSRSIGFQCLESPTLFHEWEHQLTFAVRSLHGFGSLYPDLVAYPSRGYPACGEGHPDSFAWFPDSHEWKEDPDTPWCGGPEADVGISELHVLSHFDGSLAHYPLGFFTGNHCNDQIQDFGEDAVDRGGNCPVPLLHDVVVSVRGRGWVELDPPEGPYAHGSELRLTAVRDEGCFFDGWSGNVSSFDNPLVLTVTSDLELVAEFWCQPLAETIELEPEEDTWVRRARLGRHGRESHLKLQADDKDAYLKFGLAGIAGRVLSASLSAVTSLPKGGTVDVHAVEGNDWQEETLDGANAPAIGPWLASATAPGAAREPLYWDVSDPVARAVEERAGAVSFALRMETGYQVYLAAKEHRSLAPPTLSIEWIPVPVDRIGASDDTWIDPLAGGTHGAESHLKVQRARKIVYLKFPLAGLSSVAAATLSAVTSLPKAGTVDVHAVPDVGWNEGTLAGPGGPVLGVRLDQATSGGSAGEELRWDVTATVAQAVLEGGGTVGFALVMSEGYQVYFWSKEASGQEPPLLVVEPE